MGHTLRLSLAACAAVLVRSYEFYVTDLWFKYPGYGGDFDATKITGHLEISKGNTDDDLELKGDLYNVPEGTANGIHVHDGFSFLDAGGHYYPELFAEDIDDPWTAVTYAGPDANIQVEVKGVPWKQTLGRVMVIHDEADTRVGIAKVVPKASIYNYVDLVSYPGYGDLVATIGEYGDSSNGVTGTVRVEKFGSWNGQLRLHYKIAGLAANETSGGMHIHVTEYTSQVANPCVGGDDLVKGHFWTPEEDPDPWSKIKWTKACGATTAEGTVKVKPTGYELGDNDMHAVVLHSQDGPRMACGTLHSSIKATIGAYPGTNSGVAGTVWFSNLENPKDLTVTYALDGLPIGTTEGGLHIHTGKSCDEASLVGGHFWDAGAGGDPWSTVWEKQSQTTTAARFGFGVNSGYTLAQNADHTVVVHDASGKIGCGILEYYPNIAGYITVSGSKGVSLVGNVAGVAYKVGSKGGVHVHEGSSCDEAGGHNRNRDGSDPWTDTKYEVSSQVPTPAGGVGSDLASGFSGNSHVDTGAVSGQTAELVKNKVVVVHSPNGERIACGPIMIFDSSISEPCETISTVLKCINMDECLKMADEVEAFMDSYCVRGVCDTLSGNGRSQSSDGEHLLEGQSPEVEESSLLQHKISQQRVRSLSDLEEISSLKCKTPSAYCRKLCGIFQHRTRKQQKVCKKQCKQNFDKLQVAFDGHCVPGAP